MFHICCTARILAVQQIILIFMIPSTQVLRLPYNKWDMASYSDTSELAISGCVSFYYCYKE